MVAPMTAPLFIILGSSAHEKVQMAAMLASVAAVSERSVSLFVAMDAIEVFEKGLTAERRYHGGSFSEAMRKGKAPDALDLLAQGRALGDLNIYACSMALDVKGWNMDNLVGGLFDGPMGITRLLADAEAGELVVL
jgi:peroxiredoxin family protein